MLALLRSRGPIWEVLCALLWWAWCGEVMREKIHERPGLARDTIIHTSSRKGQELVLQVVGSPCASVLQPLQPSSA